MRRWLSIFLLIVLPLQISWAVAATYCQHETGSTKHFGHHDHKHQAEDGESLRKARSLMWTMIAQSAMQAVLLH
jgi:hypothetical protein